MNQNEKKASPEQQLMSMLRGKYITRSLTAAAELAIADHIGDGCVPVADLAAKSGADEDALFRLLRALASVDVFEMSSERRFANSPISTLLRSDRPRSMRSMAMWMNGEPAWQAWGRLDHSIATGKPAFDAVFGTAVFDYLRDNPAAGAVFHDAMATFSAMSAGLVAKSYDFSQASRVVDVGGGRGALLAAILEEYPHVQGVLFDLPEMRSQALPPELGSRVERASGSFFEAVPPGADVYVLKSVLHDWDDERCVQILSNCATAAREGGRVLVVENLLGSGPESANAKFLDLEMLIMTRGGRERTEGEFAALVERAGLVLHRVYPTRSSLAILEAVKAGR